MLKSSIASPLSSGGGIGDQMQWGALAHPFVFATSMSSCWETVNSPQHLNKVIHAIKLQCCKRYEIVLPGRKL